MLYKYINLKADLLQGIAEGAFPEGSLLPSERDLARMYSISRISVRRTLQCMLDEGFLEKSPNNRSRVKGILLRPDARQLVFIAPRPLVMLPELYRKYYEAMLVKCTLLNCQLHYFDSSSGVNNSGVSLYEAGFIAGEDIKAADFPFKLRKLIQLDGKIFPDHASVSTDNFAGGCMAAQHLKNCGFSSVALLTLQEVEHDEYHSFVDRISGFRSGCRQYGMECRIITAANSTYRSVFAALQGDAGINGIRGIFVLYDSLALTVVRALNKMKKNIPEDIAILGFDGYNLGAYMVPTLSTIAQPINEIVSCALKLALEKKNSKDNFLIKPTLVLRDSTPQIKEEL